MRNEYQFGRLACCVVVVSWKQEIVLDRHIFRSSTVPPNDRHKRQYIWVSQRLDVISFSPVNLLSANFEMTPVTPPVFGIWFRIAKIVAEMRLGHRRLRQFASRKMKINKNRCYRMWTVNRKDGPHWVTDNQSLENQIFKNGHKDIVYRLCSRLIATTVSREIVISIILPLIVDSCARAKLHLIAEREAMNTNFCFLGQFKHFTATQSHINCYVVRVCACLTDTFRFNLPFIDRQT